MFKVYFTAATSFNGELHEYYKEIIKTLEQFDVQIISGYQIMDSNLLEKDKRLSKKNIFEREKKLINEADFLIAEASKPSLGVGAEITNALNINKHVLALVQEKFAEKISPIIAGNQSEYFFLEYYNQDKLPFIIDDFIKYVKNIKSKKGKFIVIEGGDGSGKTIQGQMLVDCIKSKNIPTKYIDFPQYYSSFHGKTVAKFLRGEFGRMDEISPYLASLAYALDRASVKREMTEFLRKGGYIVSNRYVQSNMAHQGAKLKTDKERNSFLKWVYELEYKIHKIPKEDVVIYLYMPWQIGIKLTEKKGDRGYLEGKKQDIQEEDNNYRQQTEKIYLDLLKNNKNWIKIECFENNKLLVPDLIHKKIVKALCERSICI